MSVSIALPRMGLVCLVYVVATLAAAETIDSPPSIDVIVARMVAVLRECNTRSHAMVVTRDYELFDKKWESKAQVVVRITYSPPDGKRYDIKSSRGGIGERVLRDILMREMEAPGDSQRELSPENYDFRLVGEETIDGRRCYVLAMNPKREERELVRGRVWLDAENYRLRRLEGDPVKSPSWWIRDLHILMSFAEVDGVWMKTLTHAVANVRFKGRYEMVSRNIEYSAPAASGQSMNNLWPGALIQH